METEAVVFKIWADEDGLWLEDGGRRVLLPGSFWQVLGRALREAGHADLASRVERVLVQAEQRRARLQAKFLCMDPAYSPEQARRCRELLEEDLKAE